MTKDSIPVFQLLRDVFELEEGTWLKLSLKVVVSGRLDNLVDGQVNF